MSGGHSDSASAGSAGRVRGRPGWDVPSYQVTAHNTNNAPGSPVGFSRF